MTTVKGGGDFVVEPWCLGHAGLDGPCHRGLLEVLRRHVPIIPLAAILTTGAPTSLGLGVGAGHRRIAPQLGKQVEAARPRQL
jgi:hypothetical protein